jgi:hypothetical protein
MKKWSWLLGLVLLMGCSSQSVTKPIEHLSFSGDAVKFLEVESFVKSIKTKEENTIRFIQANPKGGMKTYDFMFDGKKIVYKLNNKKKDACASLQRKEKDKTYVYTFSKCETFEKIEISFKKEQIS